MLGCDDLRDGLTDAAVAQQPDAYDADVEMNRAIERYLWPCGRHSASLYLPRFRAGVSTWAIAAWLLWRRRACSLGHSR